jgi:hypothetical protein
MVDLLNIPSYDVGTVDDMKQAWRKKSVKVLYDMDGLKSISRKSFFDSELKKENKKSKQLAKQGKFKSKAYISDSDMEDDSSFQLPEKHRKPRGEWSSGGDSSNDSDSQSGSDEEADAVTTDEEAPRPKKGKGKNGM